MCMQTLYKASSDQWGLAASHVAAQSVVAHLCWCCSGHDRGPHGPSRFGSRRFQAAPATSPEQPDTYSGAQVTPPARGYNEDGEVQSSSRRQANSAEPAVSAEAVATTERRATVDRECARLEAEGAPAGTRWAPPHPLNLMCILHVASYIGQCTFYVSPSATQMFGVPDYASHACPLRVLLLH